MNSIIDEFRALVVQWFPENSSSEHFYLGDQAFILEPLRTISYLNHNDILYNLLYYIILSYLFDSFKFIIVCVCMYSCMCVNEHAMA